MKKIMMITLLTIASQSIFATTMLSGKILDYQESYTIVAPKMCTLTKIKRKKNGEERKGIFNLFKKKKEVDCHGVVLEDVLIETKSGKKNIGNLLFITGASVDDARTAIKYLDIVVSGKTYDNLKVQESPLSYSKEKFQLSKITKSSLNEEVVRLGRMSFRIEAKGTGSFMGMSGNVTYNETFSIGLE